MKNRLEKSRLRSVVLGHFKSDIDEVTDLNSVVDLYGIYLPSTKWEEQEFISRVLVNLDFYKVYTIDSIKNLKGESLKIYAPVMFIEHILGIIELLMVNRVMPDGELCNFCDYIRGEENLVYPYSEVPDFWWDIYNSFFMFFGEEKEKLILSSLSKMKQQGSDVLKEADWDELSRYYYLTNSDLSEDAIEFLKPKRRVLQKQLINVLKERINQKTND